jgi:hypothetical protein
MINWLPQVCNELHSELIVIFWLMIVPLTVFLIMMELFKTADKQPDAGKVLTRAIIAIVLLMSFKETINLIAFVGDGIAEKIDGLAKIDKIVDVLKDGFSRDAPALYKIREAFIFLLNFLSYFLAYFGIFIANALIHFVWSILYVCAPLMILCYIPEGSSQICKNLYKGLLTVISWKILWSILATILLKLVTEQTHVQSDNAITTAIINLSIALSILFIPFFAKSLMGDGLSGTATGIAAVAGGTALKAGKMVLKKGVKRGISGSRNFANTRLQSFQEKREKKKEQSYQQTHLGFKPSSRELKQKRTK